MLKGKKANKKEARDRQVKSIKSPREGDGMEKETTRDFEVQVLDGTAGTSRPTVSSRVRSLLTLVG